jgi:hypothetical protein
VVRATVPGTEDLALESLEEHHIVKWVLSELDHMSPEDEPFDAKVTVLPCGPDGRVNAKPYGTLRGYVRLRVHSDTRSDLGRG